MAMENKLTVQDWRLLDICVAMCILCASLVVLPVQDGSY